MGQKNESEGNEWRKEVRLTKRAVEEAKMGTIKASPEATKER